MQNVTLFCFFASYLSALALEGARLLRPSNLCRLLALAFSIAGLVAHTIYLVVRSRSVDLPPLLGSTHDWLLVLAWTIVLTHILVNATNRQVASGVFFLPVILLLVGAARYVNDTVESQQGTLYWWKMTHASFLVLGIVGTTLSLPISVMYLMQHRKLRNKVAANDGVQLFSLETLGVWNWRLIVFSVPMLTLGMACGVALSVLSQGTEQAVDLTSWPFLILGGMWLVMIALFVWVITARRISGRVIAWRTAIVCGVLLASLLVLQVFSSGGVHGRTRATDRGQHESSSSMPVEASALVAICFQYGSAEVTGL